jgi:four helix bundle protein
VSGTRTCVSGKRGNATAGGFLINGSSGRVAPCCVRDHRSLHAWQEARGVVLGVIELARTSWKPYASALFTQLQRASLSVQLNIAEGYSFGRSPSFRRHLAIAYGSAVETGELLEIALDADLVTREHGNHLLCRNRRSQRLILGLLKRDRA